MHQHDPETIKKMKILLIDDNIMTLSLVTAMLHEFGFTNIETAGNGQDAWDQIESGKNNNDLFDIAFLDWNMPVMSGYDLLRRVRDVREMDPMAVIMITAENQKRNILEATKAGATSYIIKPVIKDDLFQKIEQVLEWRNKSFSAA